MTTIQIEKFNNAPGAGAIERYLRETKLDYYFEPADAKLAYYQNKGDTLVLRRKDNKHPEFEQGIDLMGLARKFDADEFTKMREEGRTYYRIWWD
jgi:hypothetical protein